MLNQRLSSSLIGGLRVGKELWMTVYFIHVFLLISVDILVTMTYVSVLTMSFVTCV